MREIKFRAWDKYQKKMVSQGQDVRDGHSFAGVAWGLGLSVDDDGIAMQDSTLALMQYTGLKDKNGVEIYEGDVVKSKNYRGDNDLIGHVYFRAPEFRVQWGRMKDGRLADSGRSDGNHMFMSGQVHDSWEVIGNIYENPELLEQTK